MACARPATSSAMAAAPRRVFSPPVVARRTRGAQSPTVPRKPSAAAHAGKVRGSQPCLQGKVGLKRLVAGWRAGARFLRGCRRGYLRCIRRPTVAGGQGERGAAGAGGDPARPACRHRLFRHVSAWAGRGVPPPRHDKTDAARAAADVARAQVVRPVPAPGARARQGERLRTLTTTAAVLGPFACTSRQAERRLRHACAQAAEILGDEVKFFKLDVDENPVISSQLRVSEWAVGPLVHRGCGKLKLGSPPVDAAHVWRRGRRSWACPRWCSCRGRRTAPAQACAPRG